MLRWSVGESERRLTSVRVMSLTDRCQEAWPTVIAGLLRKLRCPKKEILWHQKLKVSYWMWHMHMQTCTVHSQVLRSISHTLNIFFWSTYYKCGFKGIYSFKIISQTRLLTLWHCEHYGDVCDHTGRAESRADAASGPQQRAADARGHLEQPDARARHQLPAWPGSRPHGQARDLLRTRWKWCKWFIYITNIINRKLTKDF